MFEVRTSRVPDVTELDRVERLVRVTYAVKDDDIVLVSEEPGRQTGLPERLTTILFWIGSEARHRLRIFKPVAEVGETDLPAGWLRAALRDEGEGDCC
jgi:hypothetical protein